MHCFAGSCRFVFKKVLDWQKTAYKNDEPIRFSYEKLANLLPTTITTKNNALIVIEDL